MVSSEKDIGHGSEENRCKTSYNKIESFNLEINKKMPRLDKYVSVSSNQNRQNHTSTKSQDANVLEKDKSYSKDPLLFDKK